MTEFLFPFGSVILEARSRPISYSVLLFPERHRPLVVSLVIVTH